MNRIVTLAMVGAIIATVGVLGMNTLGTSSATTSSIAPERGHVMGHVTLVVYGPDGAVKAYRQTDNSIMNVGDDCAAVKLLGASGGIGNCNSGFGQTLTFKNIAIGTGSTKTSGDRTATALNAELTTFNTPSSGSRLAASPTVTTTAAGSGSVTQEQVTFGFTNSQTIVESGIFDTSASSTGNMFAHQTFTGVAVLSGDTLQVTWNITIN